MKLTDVVNIILAVVQLFSLVALIIYVVKTWHIASATEKSTLLSEEMLKEMAVTRQQEVAPYVIVYFDMPYGECWIHLVVKNIGKTVAREIKIINKSTYEKCKEHEVLFDFFEKTIPTLVPGQEIRSFFHSTMTCFSESKKLPQTYDVEVEYLGDLKQQQYRYNQVLDISSYKDIVYTPKKDMTHLVKSIDGVKKVSDKMARSLSSIARDINDKKEQAQDAPVE